MILSGSGADAFHGSIAIGGTGLGGIGLILDQGGTNSFHGERFCFGAAAGGIGAVLSAGGDETYGASMYSLGFGGPGGIGVLLRKGGNATIRAGGREPSGYNPLTVREGEQGFQYDTFSLGCGSGKRVFSAKPEETAFSLAGGVGMFIEEAGDSLYEASNFAMGCGYFFGAGLMMDLQGEDRYRPARYGMASGAHYGAGLFIDQSGNDHYESRGPTYNCAAAWDRTTALFIDAAGDDQYDLMRSAGLGISQHASWAVAADLAGADTYRLSSGLGASGNGSLAFFVDLASPNVFENWPPQAPFQPSDEQQTFRPPGGWFRAVNSTTK
jgi:hypothetical protein